MRLSRRAPCLAIASLFLLAGAAHADVRISQVSGGGGNSGAQYKNDFIELFNNGTESVNLAGWSVQYASSAGTTWQVTQLSGTLAAGQYMLIQEAAGAGTQPALPTPDVTGTIPMSATAGKVALVNSITALSGGCPTAQDLVGFGAASCPTTPNAPTAALSNSTAALRKTAGCTHTGNNSADFDVLAPAPRNKSTPVNVCGGGTPTPTSPTVTAQLVPSSVQVGENFTIKATVVFGTNPDSTGVDVVANLAPVGGAAEQELFDDGAHGDGAAGDKVYGFVATVAAGTSAGTKNIGIGVDDDQLRVGSTSAPLSVVQLVAIHDVQGSGLQSAMTGQTVVVEGIVTAHKSNGFFLQAADADNDANSATSEGIFVFAAGAPSAAAAVGNRVRVQGLVAEFTASTSPHQLSITELTGPVVSQLSTGNTLPTAIEITTSVLNAASPISALERYEGMRVSVPTLNVVAPVDAQVNEATGASPSRGNFYGVLPGTARPFREPGVGALDTTSFPAGVNPPVFDTNPERIRVQSTGQAGAIAMAADVGDVISGLVGVLDYGLGIYSLLPDPSASISVVPGANPTAVSVAKTNEITIGGFNLERFFDDVNDPGIGEPVLQATTLANRLKKTSTAICAYVRAPDVLGVIEVENLSVLQQLADSINSGNTISEGDCATNPHYSAHLLEGNDVGGIDTGFLLSTTEVKPGVPRVQVLELVQLGLNSQFTNKNGSTEELNDRPALLLRARINQANGAHYDVTVIGNHMRSLIDVNTVDSGSSGWSSAGERVRAKRAAQAKELAEFIHARQQANPGERIVLLGDFNAFEFNDGYTDSMGVITGREAGPTEVLNYVDSPITVPLTNLAEFSPEADRYSFSFDGNAQSLDHMVVNQALLDSTAGVRAEHARINSDFGEDNRGDFTVPVRVSDHDPVVLFLSENTFGSADVAATATASANAVIAGQDVGFGVGVANGGPDDAALPRVELALNAVVAGLQVSAPQGWNCTAPVSDAVATRSTCSGATLAVGTSAAFVVQFPTNEAMGGRTYLLTAKAGAATTDLWTSNNFDNAAVLVRHSADLAAKVLAPKVATPIRAPATFSVGVSNGGPHAAQGAVLALQVNGPKKMVSNLSSATLACTSTSDTPTRSTWSCPVAGAYLYGRTDSLNITVDPAFASAPMILVSAGFTSSTSDPMLGNNASAASVRAATGLQ